jgi:hypothetical protein
MVEDCHLSAWLALTHVMVVTNIAPTVLQFSHTAMSVPG